MRISDQSKTITMMRNIYSNSNALDKVNEQMSSQKKFVKGSDDPIGAQRVMYFKDIQNKDKQYVTNSNAAKTLIDTTESHLSNVQTLMNRAKTLSLQASTGTLSPTDMNAIAQEVGQLIEQATDMANAKFNGQYIFSGKQITTKPFTLTGSPATAVAYAGDSGLLKYKTADSSTCTVNIPGDALFSGLINNLISFRSNIVANDKAALALNVSAIDADIDNVVSCRTDLGARSNALEYTIDRTKESIDSVDMLISDAQDVDLARLTLEMKIRETAYQASLSVIAKVQKNTLIDYM